MSVADEIAKLVQLRDAGHMTAAEFDQAKARLLSDSPANTSANHSAPDSNYSQSFPSIKRLRRSRTDRWIGGVCGGIAQSTGIESWIVRLIFAVALLCWGIGLLPYALLWIFMPLDEVSS